MHHYETIAVRQGINTGGVTPPPLQEDASADLKAQGVISEETATTSWAIMTDAIMIEADLTDGARGLPEGVG